MTRLRLWTGVAILGAARLAAAKDGVSFGAGVEVLHDSNPFRLSPSQIEKFETDDQPDEKYYEMESVGDDVIDLFARVDFETRGVAGKKLQLRLEPGAEIALRNPKRTHASVEAGVAHDAWKGGELFLQGDLTPSRFKKNYLVDGVDQNGNGVSGGEKTYDAGISTEAGLLAGARQHLTKTLDGRVALGAGAESFAAPFENRDRSVTEVRAGLDLDIGKRVNAGLDARMSLATTPAGHEVVVDDRVRSEPSVDRSNREMAFTPAVSVELHDRVDLNVELEYLSRVFDTATTGDPYRDRTDTRTSALAELRVKVAKPLRLSLGAVTSRQITDRPHDADLGRRVVDWDRTAVWLGAAASF